MGHGTHADRNLSPSLFRMKNTTATPTPPYHAEMDSPLGTLTLRGTERGLTGVFMAEHRGGPAVGEGEDGRREEGLLEHARRQLTEYFTGDRRVFDLEIDGGAVGGTDFQRRVWAALGEIAYGETVSYGELARRIGQPAAVRAVGLANGRNPLSIVVPCHRVIGAGGALTGYGGGMERKRWLLDLESRVGPSTGASGQRELGLVVGGSAGGLV